MSRKIVEETIIVSALAIFKAFELNLAWLLLFGFVDFLPSVRYIERVDRIDDEKLKSPDDISSVFDIAALFEALEGNRFGVIITVERADDDKSGIGVALEFFKLANRIVDAEFSRIFRGRDDLKIIETNDGSFGFVVAKGFEKRKQLVDRFVLKFENAEIEFGVRKIVNDIVELNGVSPAPNIGSS